MNYFHLLLFQQKKKLYNYLHEIVIVELLVHNEGFDNEILFSSLRNVEILILKILPHLKIISSPFLFLFYNKELINTYINEKLKFLFTLKFL